MRKISSEELKSIVEAHCLCLLNHGLCGEACLRGVDLRCVDLTSVQLMDANLSGSNLSGSNLKDIYLRGANLQSVDFRDANLKGADLMRANLRNAKLDCGIAEAWSIMRAHFTSDALPWLMLRPNWQEEREHVHIHEE